MKRQALVVGINRYPFLKGKNNKTLHLKSAAGDAEAIAQLLEKASGDLAWSVKRLPIAQDDRFKIDGMTTVKQKDLSDAILESFNPQPPHIPDVALLFFAGHGLRQQEDGKFEGFLAASDVNTRRNRWGISLNWLREVLIKSPVKQQIIWLDCCHSGELLNFLTEDELKNWLSGGDRLLVAACRGDREAYALGDRGVLTEVLLQGLDPIQHPSGEWITSWRLVEFIEKSLETDAMLKRQIPLFRHFGEKIRFWQGEKRQSGVKTKKLKLPSRIIKLKEESIPSTIPLSPLASIESAQVVLEAIASEPEDDLNSEKGVDYTKLRDLLKSEKWYDADCETYQVMLQVLGQKDKHWIETEEMEAFPCTDLSTIDRLWIKYSKGRFGFSIQKRIWEELQQDTKQLKRFRERVGWVLNTNIDMSENYSVFNISHNPQGYYPILEPMTSKQMWWDFHDLRFYERDSMMSPRNWVHVVDFRWNPSCFASKLTKCGIVSEFTEYGFVAESEDNCTFEESVDYWEINYDYD